LIFASDLSSPEDDKREFAGVFVEATNAMHKIKI